MVYPSRFFSAVLLILVVSACISCNDDEDLIESAEFLRATVNNTPFESSSEPNGVSFIETVVSFDQTALTISSSDFTFDLTGSDFDFYLLNISIAHFTGEGTYNIGFDQIDSANGLQLQPSSSTGPELGGWNSAAGEGATGSLTISSYTPTEIRGTFECVCLNVDDLSSSINITSGSFLIFE